MKVVDKISHIVKYVTKYVTKMKELNFNKSWACSRLVSGLFTHLQLSEQQMNRCIGLTKLVFAHDVFEYSDGTKMLKYLSWFVFGDKYEQKSECSLM